MAPFCFLLLFPKKIVRMKSASLQTIAKKMKDLDICMLVTQDGRGTLHSRPMSNNGKVTYDGNSWFFSNKDTAKVRQIQNDPKVTILFQSKDKLFIECYGHASIITDQQTIEDKWLDELNQWFPEGPQTPGLCLVKVTASRVHFWEEGEEGVYQS